MERTGVISRYVTLVNPASVGLPVSVFIQVSLEKQVETALEDFEREVLERPEVMECYLMTGDADYLLRVRGDSMRDIGILEGDLLAVRSTPDAENGQIVVARIDDEVTVKRLQKRGRRVRLLPENPDFAPIDPKMDAHMDELVKRFS